MRIYLADLALRVLLRHYEIFPHKKLNVLRSFGVPSRENEAFLITHRDKVDSIILDSGTWTLNNRRTQDGIIITLGGYVNYVRPFGHLFDFYFNFDSNFTEDGFETNLFNQKRLEETGLHPVPVVHDIYGGEIDYYIERDYPMVALGSSQIRSVDPLLFAVEKLHRAGIKIHLFGTTKYEYIAPLPIFSCDSTSWAMTAAYGCIGYWNPKKEGKNKTDPIYVEEYMSPPGKRRITFSNYEFRRDLEEYLFETFGITYGDLLGTDGKYLQWLINTHFLVELEERVNNVHRQKGFDTETRFWR